jgi:fumarylpyruvate hydrolase
MYVIDEAPRPSVAVHGRRERFPVHRIYCVGRNYAEHAREMGAEPSREAPTFFMKPADAVIETAAVPYPPGTTSLHHEVELVVALGRGGRAIARERALEHVYGYAVGLDLTRRDLQAAAKAKGMPWDTAKGFDASAPISAIVPAATLGHAARGELALEVNGVVRQRADIADMIFGVGEIVAELSKLFELRGGDLIYTGTPAGVAALVVGDRFRARFPGVPDLAGEIVAPPS